jgi:hypothetical protein
VHNPKRFIAKSTIVAYSSIVVFIKRLVVDQSTMAFRILSIAALLVAVNGQPPAVIQVGERPYYLLPFVVRKCLLWSGSRLTILSCSSFSSHLLHLFRTTQFSRPNSRHVLRISRRSRRRSSLLDTVVLALNSRNTLLNRTALPSVSEPESLNAT